MKALICKYKGLIESVLSLSTLNMLNMLLPLLTMPYILPIVGPVKYGIYSYVYTVVQYLLLFSCYGFAFSATKQIARKRDDLVAVSKIYSDVTYTKLLLAFVGILLGFILSPFLFKSEELLIFIWGIGIVIGDVFNPSWLYQGMEKMRYITYVNVLSKLLFTVLIFFVVDTAEDYRYIILLNSFGFLLAGVVSTCIAYKQFGVRILRPSFIGIKQQLRDGAALFGSTISIELYKNSNVLILKFFLGDYYVGIYSVAEKLIKGIRGAATPISQALYPFFGRKFAKGTMSENIHSLYRTSYYIGALLLSFVVITVVFAHPISMLFGGEEYTDTVPLMYIMSPVILLGGLNYVLGFVGMVNLGYQRNFFYFVMLSGIISLVFLLTTVKIWGMYAAAVAMTLSELVLFINCVVFIYLKLKKVNYK